MMLTIQSATYSNPESTASVAQTVERGAVLFTEDQPEGWAVLHAWGTPTAYQAPVVVPMEVGRVQAKLWLHRAGKLSAVQSYIDGANDAELTLWWNEANVFRRDNPHIVSLSAAFDIDLDEAFTEAAQI